MMQKEVHENQDGSGTRMEEVVHLCGWAWLLVHSQWKEHVTVHVAAHIIKHAPSSLIEDLFRGGYMLEWLLSFDNLFVSS